VSDSGVVAILFTDLVGSTDLLTRLGDDAAEVLRREHFGILRDEVARAGWRRDWALGVPAEVGPNLTAQDR
jgi:class 3 adenylate cyclase